jgi:L-ascorbate metabolism protein UlaG (beta-lactamase superfamily)
MTAEPASVQFIGTATTLIRYADLTILTDPSAWLADRLRRGRPW